MAGDNNKLTVTNVRVDTRRRVYCDIEVEARCGTSSHHKQTWKQEWVEIGEHKDIIRNQEQGSCKATLEMEAIDRKLRIDYRLENGRVCRVALEFEAPV